MGLWEDEDRGLVNGGASEAKVLDGEVEEMGVLEGRRRREEGEVLNMGGEEARRDVGIYGGILSGRRITTLGAGGGEEEEEEEDEIHGFLGSLGPSFFFFFFFGRRF